MPVQLLRFITCQTKSLCNNILRMAMISNNEITQGHSSAELKPDDFITT